MVVEMGEMGELNLGEERDLEKREGRRSGVVRFMRWRRGNEGERARGRARDP